MKKTFNNKVFALLFSLLAFNFVFFNFSIHWPQGLPTIPAVGSVGFTIFILAGLSYAYLTKPREDKNNLRFALLSLVFILGSQFRVSLVDRFLLSTASTWLALIYLLQTRGGRLSALSEYILSPVTLLYSWAKSFTSNWNDAKEELPHTKTKTKLSQSVPFLRGIVFSIPILFILLALLSSADPIFGKLVENYFSFDLNLSWLGQLIVSHMVYSALFLIVFIPFLYTKVKISKINPLTTVSLNRYSIELSVLTGTTSVILFAFLIVQFKYLFTTVPERELIAFGIHTYSEYVRKGFGELLFVSFIVYMLSQLALSVYQKSKNAWLKYSNTILLSELSIFIFSVFRRVYLYQAQHGLTRIRIYGSAFLVVIFLLTLVLIIKHYFDKTKFTYIELTVILSAILIVSTINVDRLIAKVDPPTVNGEVDYMYLSGLSGDAVDSWVEAYLHVQKEYLQIAAKNVPYDYDDARSIAYSQATLSRLYTRYDQLERKYDTQTSSLEKLKTINLAEYIAYQKLQSKVTKDQIIDLQNKFNAEYIKLTPELMNRSYDRSFSAPLLW